MNEWSTSPNWGYRTYSVETSHETEALGHIDHNFDKSGWSAWIEEAREIREGEGRTWRLIDSRNFHHDDLEIAKAWVETRIALEVAQHRMAEIDFWESSENRMRSRHLAG